MTQAIKKTNMMPETGKVTSLDEYKKLTGDEQLQQIIQSAVAGACGDHAEAQIADKHQRRAERAQPAIALIRTGESHCALPPCV